MEALLENYLQLTPDTLLTYTDSIPQDYFQDKKQVTVWFEFNTLWSKTMSLAAVVLHTLEFTQQIRHKQGLCNDGKDEEQKLSHFKPVISYDHFGILSVFKI